MRNYKSRRLQCLMVVISMVVSVMGCSSNEDSDKQIQDNVDITSIESQQIWKNDVVYNPDSKPISIEEWYPAPFEESGKLIKLWESDYSLFGWEKTIGIYPESFGSFDSSDGRYIEEYSGLHHGITDGLYVYAPFSGRQSNIDLSKWELSTGKKTRDFDARHASQNFYYKLLIVNGCLIESFDPLPVVISRIDVETGEKLWEIETIHQNLYASMMTHSEKYLFVAHSIDSDSGITTYLSRINPGDGIQECVSVGNAEVVDMAYEPYGSIIILFSNGKICEYSSEDLTLQHKARIDDLTDVYRNLNSYSCFFDERVLDESIVTQDRYILLSYATSDSRVENFFLYSTQDKTAIRLEKNNESDTYSVINGSLIRHIKNRIESVNHHTGEVVWFIEINPQEWEAKPRMVWCDYQGVIVIDSKKIACYTPETPRPVDSNRIPPEDYERLPREKAIEKALERRNPITVDNQIFWIGYRPCVEFFDVDNSGNPVIIWNDRISASAFESCFVRIKDDKAYTIENYPYIIYASFYSEINDNLTGLITKNRYRMDDLPYTYEFTNYALDKNDILHVAGYLRYNNESGKFYGFYLRWIDGMWETIDGTRFRLFENKFEKAVIMNNGFAMKLGPDNLPRFYYSTTNHFCYVKWDSEKLVNIDGEVFSEQEQNHKNFELGVSFRSIEKLIIDNDGNPNILYAQPSDGTYKESLHYAKYIDGQWISKNNEPIDDLHKNTRISNGCLFYTIKTLIDKSGDIQIFWQENDPNIHYLKIHNNSSDNMIHNSSKPTELSVSLLEKDFSYIDSDGVIHAINRLNEGLDLGYSRYTNGKWIDINGNPIDEKNNGLFYTNQDSRPPNDFKMVCHNGEVYITWIQWEGGLGVNVNIHYVHLKKTE